MFSEHQKVKVSLLPLEKCYALNSVYSKQAALVVKTDQNLL